MNIVEIAADLYAINLELDRLKKEADLLKAQLKAHGSFEEHGYKVDIRTSSRTTVDPAMLKAKYATIAAECSKTSDVVSVHVKKV